MNFALGSHPFSYSPEMPAHTSAEKHPSKVAARRRTLLAGNSSISLPGSEEQLNVFHQSPKMLKMASESIIHALLLFSVLFLKISRCVPLSPASVTQAFSLVHCTYLLLLTVDINKSIIVSFTYLQITLAVGPHPPFLFQ